MRAEKKFRKYNQNILPPSIAPATSQQLREEEASTGCLLIPLLNIMGLPIPSCFGSRGPSREVFAASEKSVIWSQSLGIFLNFRGGCYQPTADKVFGLNQNRGKYVFSCGLTLQGV